MVEQRRDNITRVHCSLYLQGLQKKKKKQLKSYIDYEGLGSG